MNLNKQVLREEVAKHAKAGGWTGLTIQGLMDLSLRTAIKSGTEFLHADHSYFKRGWEHGHFRLTRNWIHQTSVVKRPDDRLRKFGVEIEPWRRTGTKVVVIPPTEWQKPLGAETWRDDTLALLKTLTDRLIVSKDSKGGLREFLSDAWAVVTWASVAGVEAALMGVPVFASEKCPAHPVSAGTLANIDKPEYKDRHDWACSLAYASWHTSEFDLIKYADYDYSYRDDLP